jgi:RHS repeat-associated protein
MAALHLLGYNLPGMHQDHLGSSRLVTGLNQAIVQSLDYSPGACPERSRRSELNSTDSGISTHKFTGRACPERSRRERDAETSLDHTQFRQYTSQLARWMTPDPAGLAAVDPGNPQSWNRYAYVLNNPMNLVDPTGLGSCEHMLFDDASCFGGQGPIVFGPSMTCYQDYVPTDCSQILAGISSGGTGGTGAVPVWTPSGCVSADGMPGSTCYPGFWSIVTFSIPAGSDTSSGNTSGGSTIGSVIGNVVSTVGTGLKKVGSCAADHYGLTAAAAGVGALGLPVPKALLGVGKGMAGASDSTSVAGAIGFKLFGAAEPRIGVALLGTTRLFGIVGRAAPFVSAALLAYDAGAIAACTYKSYQNGPQ